MHGSQLKTVGASGQISLGKEYAGRPVLVEEVEEGVWIIKTATVIPDSEMWLHEEPARSKVQKAIAWAKKHRPAETDIEGLSDKVR
jgi:hypothetical protein